MSPAKLADRRQRRTRRLVFWGLAGGLLLYFLFAGDHRPHHLALLWLEERRTEERIGELQARGAELEARLVRVESDPATLEALARQKGMVRPGDLVYHIVPVPPDVQEAAAESLALMAARQAEVDAAAEAEAEAARRAAAERPAATAPDRAPAERRSPAALPRSAPADRDPRWRWLDEPAPPAAAADTLPGR